MRIVQGAAGLGMHAMIISRQLDLPPASPDGPAQLRATAACTLQSIEDPVHHPMEKSVHGVPPIFAQTP